MKRSKMQKQKLSKGECQDDERLGICIKLEQLTFSNIYFLFTWFKHTYTYFDTINFSKLNSIEPIV